MSRVRAPGRGRALCARASPGRAPEQPSVRHPRCAGRDFAALSSHMAVCVAADHANMVLPRRSTDVVAAGTWPEAERPREKLLKRGRRRALGSGTARDPAADRDAWAHGARHGPRPAGRVPVAAWAADRRAAGGLPRARPRRGQVRAAAGSARTVPAPLCRTDAGWARRSANPRATREFLRARLRDRDHEVFCCLFLDNRHRVICFRRGLPRHDRWRERPSARGRQARARPAMPRP